jgi:putative transposase
VSPQAGRAVVKVLMTERSFGVTRACRLVGISRSLYSYRSRRTDSGPLRARIEEIAAVKRRYGYRRVYLRLRREGWQVNRITKGL